MTRLPLLAFVIAAVVGTATTSGAQTATGQITGSVKDPSGSVVPGVKVVVTNEQTGLTRDTVSNELGDYVVPLLPVGVYVVTAEHPGFKVAVRSAVPLSVDQVQRVDLRLDTGDVAERVDVTSSALALDTASATVGRSGLYSNACAMLRRMRRFVPLVPM